ncbi:hypothetical protein AB0873_11210 [Micromonospora sp. NPDC047707]|uniref:hypothetical protein n=1 Tax=Micromonospora sp. NPDC047707 TaxID=3154498 RepID=UPI0034520BD2
MTTGQRWYAPIRPAALVVVTAAATVLGAIGVLPRWPGLAHLVALPPLGLFADLRMLMVAAPNYPVFVAGLVVSLAVRITVLAFLLGGPNRHLLAYAARYYLIVLPPALLGSVLILGAGATLYFGLFWMGTVVVLATVALSAAAPWSAPPRLAHGYAIVLRHGLRLGTVGAYLAALTALGAVADLTRPIGPVAAIPASALLTLGTARFLRADPGHRLARRSLAAGYAALITVIATVAVSTPTLPRAPRPDNPRPGSLMLMSGVDSSSGSGAILEIDPHTLGYTCAQTYYYSYAGPGTGQPRNAAKCPITTGAPYQPVDTLRPTEELITFLDDQLADLPPPVVLITHSQGVWITWQAAVAHRLPNVAALVLIGPFPTNPVPYPRHGEAGVSKVAAGVTRLVSGTARPGGTSVFTPDSPLGREWLAHPTAIQATLAQPPPDNLRILSVPSVFDLPLMPTGPTLPAVTNHCPIPVIHPDLPYSAEFQRSVTQFLDHDLVARCPPWRHAIGPMFRPFSVPAWDA